MTDLSETFLIAALQQEAETATPQQTESMLKSVLQKARLKPHRVQEIHWFGDDLTSEQISPLLPKSARYSWADPSLQHFVLQSTAQACACAERDLVLLGQTWENHACGLLVASTHATGRDNLLPAARIAARLTFHGLQAETLFPVINNWMQKTLHNAEEKREAAQKNGEEAEDAEPIALPTAQEVAWVACGDLIDLDALAQTFPKARRLAALPPAPPGDLFLLTALLRALLHTRERWGWLISIDAARGAALATLIERV